MRRRSLWRSAISLGLITLAGVAQARPPLTVGPHGAYRTLQAALTAAATLADAVDVRVESVTLVENVVVAPCCAGTVTVSGGWDAAFGLRTGDPGLTVVDGRSLGRPIEISSLASGGLTLQNLTLRNGLLSAGPAGGWPAFGAGLYASVSDTGGLTLRSVYVRNNRIRAVGAGAFEGDGGGAFVLLNDAASLLIQSSLFEANSIVEAAGASLNSHGGGLEVQVFGGSATIHNSLFRGNLAGGSDVAVGGGLAVLVQGLAGLGATLVGNTFDANRVAPGGSASGADLGAYDGHGSPNIVMRRSVFRRNTVGSEQVDLHATNGARVDLSDTLVYGGDHEGLHLFGSAAAYLNLTNVTAADNADLGIEAQALHSKLSVFNTIAFGNGRGDLDLHGDTAYGGFNLVGVDPLFRAPAAGDYRLLPDSPARDAGTNRPPGPLGAYDLSGGPRLAGGLVDVGADEID